jgi:hypothetical protein
MIMRNLTSHVQQTRPMNMYRSANYSNAHIREVKLAILRILRKRKKNIRNKYFSIIL